MSEQVEEDKLLQRVKNILAMSDATKKLRASADDLWEENSYLTACRSPEHPGVILIFLDRTHGKTPMTATFTVAVTGIDDEEASSLSIRKLLSLVGRRIDMALSRFRPTKLAESDSSWIEPELLETMGV